MTRHFWVLVHRYAGLYMAFFLIVAGLTGSIMAFTPEINDWANPPIKVTEQAGSGLDEFTLRERALALVPQATINRLFFNRKPDEPYTAQIEPRINPETGKPYELDLTSLTLNPYTGAEMTRDKQSGDLWPITKHNFMALIITLHYSLVLPNSIGIWLFGIAALL